MVDESRLRPAAPDRVLVVSGAASGTVSGGDVGTGSGLGTGGDVVGSVGVGTGEGSGDGPRRGRRVARHRRRVSGLGNGRLVVGDAELLADDVVALGDLLGVLTTGPLVDDLLDLVEALVGLLGMSRDEVLDLVEEALVAHGVRPSWFGRRPDIVGAAVSTLARRLRPAGRRDAYHRRMPLLTVADQMPWEGFSVNNLLILIVILAILLPLMRWIRRRVSESRRERWAQEDDAETRYTEENDPDLRRNHPEG